jgi:hypothetical protein
MSQCTVSRDVKSRDNNKGAHSEQDVEPGRDAAL